MKVTQLVAAAVPVRVLQATIAQLDGAFALPIAAPADALPETGVKRGGLDVAVQPRLTGALPGVRRFFETYPFICLEQKTSKSVGLKDAALWAGVANALPTYLDSDGLASYFPPRAGEAPHGSDRLTAYVLAATNEAGFALPRGGARRDARGLTAFVEGRIERKFWSPRADLDVRKLAAIEALSRYGRAQPRMLGSINVVPNPWPTAAVIDWLNILQPRRRHPRSRAPPRRGAADPARAPDLRRHDAQVQHRGERLLVVADGQRRRQRGAPDPRRARRPGLEGRPAAHGRRQPRAPARRRLADDDRQPLGLARARQVLGEVRVDAGRRHDTWRARLRRRRGAASASAPRTVADWSRQAERRRRRGSPGRRRPATLNVAQDGTGKPWLTVQSLAAIPLKAPLRAGYASRAASARSSRRTRRSWSRGDVVRVRLEIDAQSDMTWVVVNDPVPGGATILGSGLGRDSQIATRGEKRAGSAWPAYEERSFEAFRSYYDYLPRGKHVVEYTVRLNNPGRFALPPTRVEAMYAPEIFGELPNAGVEVAP